MNPRIALLVPLFVLGACTKDSPPTSSPASAASPAESAPSSAPTVASAPSAAPAPSGAPAEDPLIGAPAPDFTATAQDGTSVHVGALKGKPVIVYFYPKDETAGCTKEACSFRDAWDAIGKTGAVLVGVSADTLDSHKAFVAHYKLPFLLVSDPDGAIGKLYGVPFQGVHKRQTVIIGADGRVRRVYRKVDVGAHAQEVLGDLRSPA